MLQLQKVTDLLPDLADYIVYAAIAIVTLIGVFKCLIPLWKTTSALRRSISRLQAEAGQTTDKPVWQQYLTYLWNLLHGDLGSSQITGLSVWSQFSSRWPNTLWLALFSILLGTVVAIPLGIFAAKHAGSIWDNLTTAFTMIGISMPSFWLGLMLLIWFAGKLKIFPAAYDGTWKSFVLPVFANGFAMIAGICRQTRSAILEVSRADFLRTARAKARSARAKAASPWTGTWTWIS